jgi:SAM-dependent methyltransferase
MSVENSNKDFVKDVHPVINDEYLKYFSPAELYSVEASLDSLIPWINSVDNLENKEILVFGTGGGGTVVACALNIGNGKVYGVDINDDAIKTTFKRAEVYGVLEKIELKYLRDTYPLPLDDCKFDMVLVVDVIEHIVNERKKYLRECFRVLKKNGLLIITGTPNLLYPKDYHTTGLYFIPWLPSKLASKYAVFRGKWEEGKDLDYSGRKGANYWQIRNWLKGFDIEILNIQPGFTSRYLKNHKRLNSLKRKILFKPYEISEWILTQIFKIPVTAFMPYINHLFIRKK